MKKLFKIFLKTTLVFTVIFIVVFMFLLSDWNSMYKKEDFVFLKEEIQKASSEDFIDIPELYNKVYDVKNTKQYMWISNQNEIPKAVCPCFNTFRMYSYMLKNNNSSRFRYELNKFLFSLKLEQEFSQDDCLKFFLNHFEFLGHKGIKSASNYYFEKDLKDLNLDEKLTLIVMTENPSLYNPRRRAELVKEKVELYKKRLN